MVISTFLLSKFVSLKDIPINQLVETLNDIGLEVEAVNEIKIPNGVVVGKVISKDSHPNADKLSVCQVDIGSKTLQIVCGAKNVDKNQFIALATQGTTLNIKKGDKNENLTIKNSNLRGVESCGMICSSSELGLESINEGIMVLDSSIGELILGKELNEYGMFNQFLIEISLTPNRGDCLNILGVAREIAAAFRIPLRLPVEKDYGVFAGIGRALNLSVIGQVNSLLLYKVIEFKEARLPLVSALMLAINGNLKDSVYLNLKNYATYISGVLFNFYPLENELDKPETLIIQKGEFGFETICEKTTNKELSKIGVINNFDESSINGSAKLIVEASYTPPEFIAKTLHNHNIKHDKELTYRSIRGSNPELQIGINIFCNLVYDHCDCEIYSSSQEIELVENNDYVCAQFSDINNIIGKQIDQEEIALILKSLNFRIEADGDGTFFRITPPVYRHDIKNIQDIAEEVLRMYKIKNIQGFPYKGIYRSSYKQTNEEYKNKQEIRIKALSEGFYETIHYVFYQKSVLEKWGKPVLKNELDITNPITSELNTLRSSLLPAMIDSIIRNQNLGFKNIKLFEIGSVYDENRTESKNIAFVASGLEVNESYPSPKGEKLDFYSFSRKLAKIIGAFKLVPLESSPVFAHPYQSANIIQNDEVIGIIGAFNPAFIKEIPNAFFAELNKIPSLEVKLAKPYSKFQRLQRDLTILVDKNIPFFKIKEKILESKIDNLIAVYPLDVYDDGEFALTIRMIFQPLDSSLTEEEILSKVNEILSILESNFNAKLKL